MSDYTKDNAAAPVVDQSGATTDAHAHGEKKESLGHKIAEKMHALGQKHDETVDAQAEHLVNDTPAGGKPFTLQT